MRKEEVYNCRVLGHSEGPDCPTCDQPMDRIRIEEGGMEDLLAFYCYFCPDTK